MHTNLHTIIKINKHTVNLAAFWNLPIKQIFHFKN